ncbi:MAG: molybdopterin converting factor subunit 1 [Burkholderiales bacterium]|nr:molybdopterin converting factor subunit 1 [Burkholderiales bacterium]PZN03345.1 MAG: molybdopterin converting factor subunit 1 [Pseudomonadota bacterium]
MVRLLFFARLREELGTAGEDIHLPEHVNTVKALRRHLMARGEAWKEALGPNKVLRVSVNHEMAQDDTPVRAGDEVAFFPPVTGG